MALNSLHCVTASPRILSFSRPKCHNNRSSASPARRVRLSMTQNQSYWASINADVEAHLTQAIPLRPPLSVFEPMHHLVFSAPRNPAPALCLAACDLVGGQREQAIAAASALHLIHAAAFTHENLPLSDRPNTPTHHAFGPNVELLTGDGILPFVYELLARSDESGSSRNESSEKILRVILEIARASGAQGMIDGQYHWMRRSDAIGGSDCEIGWLSQVCEKKEGGLSGCGAACGAILGGGSEEEIEKLRRYGKYVGMVHGMVKLLGAYRGGDGTVRKEEELLEQVERLRSLGLEELESFRDRDVDAISALMEEEISFSCFPR